MRVLLLAAIVTCGALLQGCATAQARAEVPLPELMPPPSPPRVVAMYGPPPNVPPLASPVEPMSPPDSAGSSGTSGRPAARPAAPAPAPTPPAPRAATPSLTLTPAPGTEAQTEKSIRAIVARASQDLARVNYAALGTDRRTQYDTARRFVQQAEEALKARNLVFAGKLADKAATMAAVLVR